MIKIMHMADVHLDSPFSLRSPTEAESLRTILRGAFTSACHIAGSGRFDLVLIAGDLFDSEYVTADTKELLVKTFSSFPEVRFFITPGNHDPLTENSVYNTVKFPPNVHVFGAKPECVRLEELGVCVYGRAFTSRTMEQSPLSGYGELDKSMINILVCHGEMSPLSACGPITKKEIAASGFDYVALGHIHTGSGLQKEGETYWCYPGCLVGRSFDETGVKGCMIGTVGKGEADMRLRQLSEHIYEKASLELTSGSSKQEAIAQIRGFVKKYGQNTVLRLTLTGETDGGVTFSSDELQADRKVILIDNTTPSVNFTELEKSNTVKGAFYRIMMSKMDALEAGSEEYRTHLHALKLGLAALSGHSIAEDCTKEDRQ